LNQFVNFISIIPLQKNDKGVRTMEKTNFQYIQDTQTLIGNRTRELLDVETGEKDQPALRKIRAADETGGRCAERGRRYENQISGNCGRGAR
jgi:hypothetical protein